LSKLLDEVAGEPVQVEVSAVRVLFELLGFLLRQLSAVSLQLSVTQQPSRLNFIQQSKINNPQFSRRDAHDRVRLQWQGDFISTTLLGERHATQG
jgi:hypothetical protein